MAASLTPHPCNSPHCGDVHTCTDLPHGTDSTTRLERLSSCETVLTAGMLEYESASDCEDTRVRSFDDVEWKHSETPVAGCHVRCSEREDAGVAVDATAAMRWQVYRRVRGRRVFTDRRVSKSVRVRRKGIIVDDRVADHVNLLRIVLS